MHPILQHLSILTHVIDLQTLTCKLSRKSSVLLTNRVQIKTKKVHLPGFWGNGILISLPYPPLPGLKKKGLKTQYSTDNNAGTWQEVLKNDTVVVQGCKSQSLIEDCSKTYRTTHDKIFTVDLQG